MARKYHQWNTKEIAYLKANYGKVPTPEIANKLGVTFHSVQKAAYRFCSQGKVMRSRWTPEEDRILRESYPGNINKIAKALNRPYHSVNSRIRTLKITQINPWRAWHPEEIRLVENLIDQPTPIIQCALERLCIKRGWQPRSYHAIAHRIKQIRAIM